MFERNVGMASTARLGLKQAYFVVRPIGERRRNGLYSPFGIETMLCQPPGPLRVASEWPLQPVWD